MILYQPIGLSETNNNCLNLGALFKVVYSFLPFLVLAINGPPPEPRVDPDNSGEGGKDVKDQESKTSVPDETSGKPDSGKPGGPSTPDPGEGGKGGATGDKPDNAGGTDTGAGGGATGTNVTPVGPTKPVVKPKPPKKPDNGAGGPGTPGGKQEVG